MCFKKTKDFLTVECPNCSEYLEIKNYTKDYIDALVSYSKIAHNAIKQLIEQNKVSAAMKIYYPNSKNYETIGNIRADAPHKYDK